MTTIQDTIQNLINTHKVILFMKGSPDFPQCGFSFQVAKILNAEKIQFHSINVLENPEIREGIKLFSDWPTIPQLYINGTFIGGCDIVTECHESGELQTMLAQAESA